MLKFILALLTSMFMSAIATCVYYENKMQKQRIDMIDQATKSCYTSWKRGYKIGHKHGKLGYSSSQELQGL